tara:strand:+ start:2671 stop:3228 length:558 start_codon:yes stop_codon:yes gene_type:complete
MSNLEDIITRVADFIKRYKCIDTIKICFTLGKYTEEFGFKKHIFQFENYMKIINLLENCNTWEDKSKTENKKIKYEPEKIVDSLIIRCQNGPYDIIITAQTKKTSEIYISEDFTYEENVYKRKNHTFRVSKHSTNLDEKFYTASIIADIPKKYTDTYIAHSSLLKVKDLILACENKKEELVFVVL